MTPSRLVAGLLGFVLVMSACSSDDDGTASDAEANTPDPFDVDDLGDTELAAEAYVAGYPLAVSVRTLQRLGGLIGVNTLYWQTELSGPDSRVVVAPNRDTLYSVAVLDLRSEPLVLTLPEVTDRYYTYQFLDAWTESFEYIGTRATGGRAGSWVITPPGWEGDLPAGTEQIESTTPQVFLLGRYVVDDEEDIANVSAIGDKASLQPLSEVTGEEAPPSPPPLGEPPGTPQEVPTDASFFDELGDALAANPPTTTAQQELFDEAERLGIGPDAHPTQDGDSDAVAVLDEGATRGNERISGRIGDAGETLNGWSVNLDIGSYDDDTLLRAVVARVGWGANVPAEAVYPITRVDADGEPLDGSATYRITFPPDALPPVDAFWSLSVYGADMFITEHPSGRYSIGDRTPDLTYGDDGSLELVLSHTKPSGEPANWLPVPEGPFVLMLRLYLPGPAILDGAYEYPPIERDPA